jgi:hypothetical protein
MYETKQTVQNSNKKGKLQKMYKQTKREHSNNRGQLQTCMKTQRKTATREDNGNNA